MLMEISVILLNPENLKVGDEIISGENVPLKNANSLPLKNIPAGINVHNIELFPGKGGQMARSAGAYAQIMAHDNNMCTLKLPLWRSKDGFIKLYGYYWTSWKQDT